MKHNQVMKRMAVLAVLTLVLAVVSSATVAAPPAQEPESVACGDYIVCSTASDAVYVRNTGVGAVIYGHNTSTGFGLKGRGNPGVYGFSYHGAGIRGKSRTNMGVKAESDSGAGVYATSVSGTGVYGQSDGYSGEGVHGHGTAYLTEGVLGTSDQNVGVYGISSGTQGNNIGVWGQSAGTWGFFSNESIWVNGCTGCTLSFVGRNADVSALEVGDVVSVSGVESPLVGQQTPILKVRHAAAGSAVLGIVLARAEIDTAQARVPAADSDARKAIEVTSRTEGSVVPGDYLFIVVQGLVQVRADAAADIQAGDWLMADGQGLAALAEPDASTIGQAVDAVDPATGLVWVLVDLQ